MRRPLPASLAAGILVLSACGPADDDTPAAPAGAESTDAVPDDPGPPDDADAEEPADEPDAAGDDGGSFAVDQVESSPRAVDASGILAWQARVIPSGMPDPLVDLEEIRSGGPPPDGIPPVDRPRFHRVDDVDFLADNEPVLALEIDGDARAYPIQIMTWHEIVNDTVAGIPVSVTYCPLCNSAVAYDRRLGDRVLDFGTSGLLWNSALVMYDRQTETLWSHFTGQGVVGELTGSELDKFPVATVAWGDFRAAHPDGLVLSRDTGFRREYGRNPYPGYDDVEGVPFLFEGDVDGRYTALTRIVGFEEGGEAVGIPLVALQDARLVSGSAGGTAFVAWWSAGTSSALDTADIASGRDVGATGVFVPEVDDMSLTFEPDADGGFVDAETGSTWSVLGIATAGPLAGERLTAIPHVDTFWFAWSTFRPDTTVLTP